MNRVLHRARFHPIRKRRGFSRSKVDKAPAVLQTMPSPQGHGKEGKAMAESEALNFIYPPSSFKAPHVYRDDRRYAVVVVDMLQDFIYGVLKTDRMVPKIPNV